MAIIVTSLPQGYVYPVIRRPRDLKTNAKAILKHLGEKEYNVVGTGTSGAMILSAMAVQADVPHNYCLLKKPGEPTHRNPRDGKIELEKPTIVVDEWMATGETMRTIAHSLSGDYVATVKLVSLGHLSGSDKRLLETFFPSLETILTNEFL